MEAAANMLRHEARTGKPLKHLIKAQARITNLQNRLLDTTRSLSRLDRKTAERVIEDLRSAITEALNKGIK